MSIAYQEKAKTLKRSAAKRDEDAKTVEEHLYADLEQLDSVLLFAYGFWARSATTGTRDVSPWESLLAYTTSVRARWQKRIQSITANPPIIHKEYVTAKMVLGLL